MYEDGCKHFEYEQTNRQEKNTEQNETVTIQMQYSKMKK